MKTVSIKVFLKDGGNEITSIPSALFFDLAKNIQVNGSEKLRLASGKEWVITGFMVYGKEFLEESKIIVVEGKSNESSPTTLIH